MNNSNFKSNLDYFRSIPSFGKAINIKGTEFYDIKFCCNIDLARKIVVEFRKTLPDKKDNLLFHVNKDETNVTFGGRFTINSRIKNYLYDLIDKHK